MNITGRSKSKIRQIRAPLVLQASRSWDVCSRSAFCRFWDLAFEPCKLRKSKPIRQPPFFCGQLPNVSFVVSDSFLCPFAETGASANHEPSRPHRTETSVKWRI
uniref:Zinc finger protein 706 n=1 Tax=Schistocephalus solidus TaxID=70667 RepID=A0A0X3PTU8_SCHSO